jgi:hypothetical protein
MIELLLPKGVFLNSTFCILGLTMASLNGDNKRHDVHNKVRLLQVDYSKLRWNDKAAV